LVATLLLTRLDYGNAALYGLSVVHLRRLQSVQNAAARLIFGLRRIEHIRNALFQLYWLRVPEQIRFKLAGLTYRAFHGSAPSYLCVFTQFPAFWVIVVSVQRFLTASLFLALDCRLLAIERSQSLVLPFGTVFQRTFTRHLPLPPQITIIHCIPS
jgi:hypothetical protein